MPKIINPSEDIGKKYGRLTIMSIYHKTKGNPIYYNAICDCGKITKVQRSNLKNGHTVSCGCRQREIGFISNLTHGKSKTPLYQVYKGIKARCFNEHSQFYNYYGGRGITMCDEWRNDYSVFMNWCFKNGYKKGLQIDRIDTNGNYEPTNCRFVTCKINSRNRRNVHVVEYNGEQVFLIDLYKKSQVGRKAFYRRIQSGWSIKKAIETPNQSGIKC